MKRLANSTAALNKKVSTGLGNEGEVSAYKSSPGAGELCKKIEAMIRIEPDAETVLRARTLRDEGVFHKKPSHRVPKDLIFDRLILECGHSSFTTNADGPDITEPLLCHDCAGEWMHNEMRRKKSN
jgi:hypothetical protein